MQRRRRARSAVAPGVIFVFAIAGGPSLAASAPSPASQPAPPELMLAPTSGAMQAGGSPASPPPFMRPNVRIVRIDPSEAPTIDANLSDPVWAKAAVIDNFTQRQPNPYEPGTERTVVRILYDENNLYFSFYNYDSTPGANRRPQHAARRADLHVRLGDDLSRSRANAAQRLQFRGRRVGGRQDALELNNTEELTEWDAIWEARARVVQDGWVAEVVIPFKIALLRARPNHLGLRCRAPHLPQERARPLVGVQSRARLYRRQPVGRSRRDRECEPGHRARRADLWRAQSQARLAARGRWRGIGLHRGRQRLLQGDASADQYVDRQSGFFRRAAGHPPGQHHAVLAVHAGNPRLLPARRIGVRIRRAQLRTQLAGPRVEQRTAVLLAQYRPRARASGEPDRRATNCPDSSAASTSAPSAC